MQPPARLQPLAWADKDAGGRPPVKLSIWLASSLFVWGAPVALIASLFTLPNAFWLIGVIIGFSMAQ
jgi:hypothetical protein